MDRIRRAITSRWVDEDEQPKQNLYLPSVFRNSGRERREEKAAKVVSWMAAS